MIDEFEKRKKSYPHYYNEAVTPQPEAMFDPVKLHEAYDYFIYHLHKNHQNPDYTAQRLFYYLNRLEKDIPLNQQRTQP